MRLLDPETRDTALEFVADHADVLEHHGYVTVCIRHGAFGPFTTQDEAEANALAASLRPSLSRCDYTVLPLIGQKTWGREEGKNTRPGTHQAD